VLERAVARVRSRANERLWQRATMRVTPEQRTRLEQLLVVLETDRTSPFDRLRDGPVLRSPAELGRAIERLEEVQSIAVGLPSLERLPPEPHNHTCPFRQRRQVPSRRAVAR
jgi:hypothetical protein